MKKMIASLLVALLVFGMFGCSQPEDQPETTGNTDTMNTTVSATEMAEPEQSVEMQGRPIIMASIISVMTFGMNKILMGFTATATAVTVTVTGVAC